MKSFDNGPGLKVEIEWPLAEGSGEEATIAGSNPLGRAVAQQNIQTAE